MNKRKTTPGGELTTGQEDRRLQRILHSLADDSPERRAIDAGEIDAIIDYKDKHIILFPLAEQVLRAAPGSAVMPDPGANAILAALPRSEYQRLRPALEPILLTANELLQESGAPIRYVYFPIDSVISLLATVESPQLLEVALVGAEGMVGIPLALGVNVSPVRVLVGIAGSAVRIPEVHFREVYRQNPALRKELKHYTYTELVLARQTAVCCAFHTIGQRFTRRLLMITDRLHSNQFFCTHESAAYALGVRRESITHAASALQKRGLIAYHRGQIRILNRRGLESTACRCYTRIERRPVQAVSQASV